MCLIMYEIILGEIIVCICVMYGLYSLNKLILTNKLVNISNKLRSQIANFKQEYTMFEGKSEGIVKGALGDIGLEGIMGELGIDPKILNNPLVKGLIDKYAPKVLEQLSKSQKGNNETMQGLL